uniref:Metalloendopeptidase n=1 Tax=Clytia hemisphaerica TaxID=252671 RepID=A0A7M5WZJ0_9CNID
MNLFKTWLLALLMSLMVTASSAKSLSSETDWEERLEEEVEILRTLREEIEDSMSNDQEKHIPDETDIDQEAGTNEILGNEIKKEDASDQGKHIPDETDIDQKSGTNEILGNGTKKDGSTMTEVEINELLGYEGDEMILSEEQQKRGVSTSIRLWRDQNTGVIHIPYEIDSSIASSDHPKILRHISEMNEAIRCSQEAWKPKTPQDKHYVLFRNSAGCSSYLGITKFQDSKDPSKTYQPISLAAGCIRFNQGTVLHEMLHCMGFSHEQSRSDRDEYVTINWSNIIANRERNFQKVSNMMDGSKETDYDYGSVLHYGRNSFGKTVNGVKQETITPKDSNAAIGQRNGMSKLDIEELNLIYCPEAPETTSAETTPAKMTTPLTTTTTISTTTTTTPTTTTTTTTPTTTMTTTTPKTTTTTPKTTTTTPTTTTTTTTPTTTTTIPTTTTTTTTPTTTTTTTTPTTTTTTTTTPSTTTTVPATTTTSTSPKPKLQSLFRCSGVCQANQCYQISSRRLTANSKGYQSTNAWRSGFIAFRFKDCLMKKICSDDDFYNLQTKKLCLSIDHKRTKWWWSPRLVVYSRAFVNMRHVNYAPRRTNGTYKLDINMKCKSSNWLALFARRRIWYSRGTLQINNISLREGKC